MLAIISRETQYGMPDVGTNDRILVSTYKTMNGIRRFAKDYAKGKVYRIQFFHGDSCYQEPFLTEWFDAS